MTKIAINTCWGGFALSIEAVKWLKSHGMERDDLNEYIEHLEENEKRGYWFPPSNRMDYEFRMDPILIACIEELGDRVNTTCSEIAIKEFDETKFTISYIDDYDGCESLELKRICRREIIEEFVVKGDTDGLTKYLKTFGVVIS